MSRAWTGYDTIKALGALLLLILLLVCMARQGTATPNLTLPTLSAPALGAALSGPRVDFSGRGQPGGLLRLFLGGKELTLQPLKIGGDGAWSLPGVDLSKLGLTPGGYDLELRAVDSADPNKVLGTTSVPFSLPNLSAESGGGLAVSEPASGAQLPAGGFVLKGTGKAGDELEILEDGTSLGRVKVGADGSWSLNVPSPSAGAHTYEAKGAAGSATTKVTVAAPTANAGTCTKDFTLSLGDGQTVGAPFRFGGEGGGKGYTVTVKRGGRVVGTKEVPLDSTCGWSYASNPGRGQITYEVREAGATGKALAVINLNVR